MAALLQNYCIGSANLETLAVLVERLRGVPPQNGFPAEIAEQLAKILADQGYVGGCECVVNGKSIREYLRDEPWYILLRIIYLMNVTICECEERGQLV